MSETLVSFNFKKDFEIQKYKISVNNLSINGF